MQTIPINRNNAAKAYQIADDNGKKVLEMLLGTDAIKPVDIRQLINGWDDILKLSGKDAEEFELRDNETLDELAYRKAKLIAKVYNQDEVLDAANTSQYKYYPWHKIVKDESKPSGFGLSYGDYVYWASHSFVGVRLCFSKSDNAIDAGKKFIDIYEQLKVR